MSCLSLIFFLFLASQLVIHFEAYAMSLGMPSVTVPKLISPGHCAVIPPPNPYLVLTTGLTNNYDYDLQFVILLEVRDSDGVTQLLESHSGSMAGNGRTEVGSLWRFPQDSGQYELRAFAISNFTNPTILTEVKSILVDASHNFC
jgi:hypothetical protein